MLNDIRREIDLYYSDNGKSGVNGIMSAFRTAVDKDTDLYVLTETVSHDGKTFNVFLLLKSNTGHRLYPLFTDITEMMTVKNSIDSTGKLNTGMMKLYYVLKLIAEKNICDGIIVNPSTHSFTAPVSLIEDIYNR